MSAMNSDNSPWAVAIFAARETPNVLEATLSSVRTAAHKPAIIDVLVNGNRSLAEEARISIRGLTRSSSSITFHVWFVALGDKANAWSQYLHCIWPGVGVAYFIDGYVRPNPDALERLEQGLCNTPLALAASGVPSVGRTAAKLREEQIRSNGIHGNLHCLRADAMLTLRNIGFHLPLGLYRTDSTIGAVIKFAFDPEHHNWEPKRVLVDESASWVTDEKHWWRYVELKGHAKRLIRQAQGDLENRAVRHHLHTCRRAPQAMPSTVLKLIEVWLEENPVEGASYLKSPLRRYALRQVQLHRDWSLAEVRPELIETIC